MPLADLTSFKTMIRIGRLISEKDFALAIQAAQKVRRFTDSDVELLIASDDRAHQLPEKLLPGLSCHAPSVLNAAITHYRRTGNLFAPCRGQTFSHEFLYALASGVPLDAMNYRRISSEQAGEASGHGEAVLGVR